MNMKKAYFVSAALLMSAAVSFGQNFNPTVEVTNTYQGSPSEVQKPLLGMNVPDSLLRFDLDFDYEVFNKPYQGAYNFKPYMLDMRPEKDAWRGRKLYLKAGAGYTFHPQLEFVFSPERKGPFQMSVYASHKSYFGNYHEIAPQMKEAGVYRLKKSGEHFSGYDALTAAGFDGLYSWDKTLLSLNLGYYGVAAKDSRMSHAFNAFDFSARVRSNNDAASYFFYDVAMRGRIAGDNSDIDQLLVRMYSGESAGKWNLVSPDRQKESWFFLDGLAGTVMDDSRGILVGFEGETSSYGKFYDGNLGRIAIIPSYRFRSGRWDLNLGLKLEAIFRNDASDSLCFRKMTGGKGQIVYPDVHVGFAAGGDVRIYADATGGSRLNTYSSQIARTHHHNPLFLVPANYGLLTSMVDNTVENLNARIGVKGNIASLFRFDFNGGVGIYENLLMESGRFLESAFIADVAYSDANLVFANALLGFQSERFEVEANLKYRSLSFDDKDADNLGFALPKYSGDLRMKYNINSRLHAGISVAASSWRDGRCGRLVFEEHPELVEDLFEYAVEDVVEARIPGYVDLGLNCGYKFNRKLELWLESGNLLCQTIQRSPSYAEKGPWVTAGITLNL